MNTNTRIVLYSDDPEEGGVAVYTHALACGLARRRYDVTCVQTEASNPMIELQQKLGVHHRWLPFHSRKDFRRTMINEEDAAEAFKEIKPDLVIFANCDPLSNIAPKTAAVRAGLRFIVVENYVWPYQNFPENLTKFLPALENHCRHARAVIAVCKENLDLLHKGFRLPPDKGLVIHYGRPDAFFAPRNTETRGRIRREFNIPADAVLCLTIGRLEFVKGHELIVNAMRSLMDRPAWSNLYFAWLGNGSMEEKLKADLEELGVSDRVIMPGRRWDVVDWLDASDIFILPSYCEGMPISVMEAMAKGLPCMATAISGTPEELGDTGKLLTSPMDDAEATTADIVATLEQWVGNPQLRSSIGAACQARASGMFREERMIALTRQVIDRALLPAGDYVAPGLAVVRPDACFPNMIVGDRAHCTWAYLRRDIPHNWYVDKRSPQIGFVNRDEAHILFNTALHFRGKRCLEVGCWLGWSTCHLALGGVVLDVIDPMLANPEFLNSVRSSLQAAGVLQAVNLINGASPQAVEMLGWQHGRKWSLFFIDGLHDGSGPVTDCSICSQFAEPDALIMLHDLASPDVARGLEYLKYRGWNTMIYSTMQIMGVAWRGAVSPILHRPDPQVELPIPEHLRNCLISGRHYPEPQPAMA
jgi:glycosyltransferase involved in cell wall biosynthesis/predicted O-methyltransferase YrrM